MYKKCVKPAFDFFVALLVTLVFSPVMLLLLLLLCITFRGKPFFIQKRPGKHEKEIRIIKFKSMNDKKDPQGNLLPNHMRITKLGNFLRKTSLDELPQLFNVMKGDLSLVGPRPLLFKYIPLYSQEQRQRHNVKPGITGWAQVNGRNAISWTKKFEYDIYYVEHLSFLLDIKILWLTFRKVIAAEGINAGSQLTMEPFNGYN